MGSARLLWQFGLNVPGEFSNRSRNVDYAFCHMGLTFTLDFGRCWMGWAGEGGEEGFSVLPCAPLAAACSSGGELALLASDGLYVVNLNSRQTCHHLFDNEAVAGRAVAATATGFFVVGAAGTLLMLRDGMIDKATLPLVPSLSGAAYCDRTGRLAMTSAKADKVVVLNSDFSIIHEFGGALDSDGTSLLLHAPRGCAFNRGDLAVCDSNNNRLLFFDDRFTLVGTLGGRDDSTEDRFWRPISPFWSNNGELVCADSKNARAVVINKIGSSRQPDALIRRLLCLPRSAVPQRDGSVLIADCHNNRVLSLIPEDGSSRAIIPYVKWPRHAWRLPGEGLRVLSGLAPCDALFDSRNGLAASQAADWPCSAALNDPHQYSQNESGKALIVNTGLNEIIVTNDPAGALRSLCGRPLDDPHSAAVCASGCIAICDTGNNRLLWSDREAREWRQIDHVTLPDGTTLDLNGPRHVQFTTAGTLILVDTGSRSVSEIDQHGRVKWIIGPKSGFEVLPDNFYAWGPSIFHDPRWAHLQDDTLFVSDTGNCRILAFHIPKLRV